MATMFWERRKLLQAAAAAVLLPRLRASQQPQTAREALRLGSLGEITFCRLRHKTVAGAVAAMRFLLDGEMPQTVIRDGGRATLRYASFVASYEPGAPNEIVLCGTQATLAVNERGHSLHSCGRAESHFPTTRTPSTNRPSRI